MRSGPVGVGVLGAGMISSYYLENLTQFPDLRVVGIADLDPGRARLRATEFGLQALTVQNLLEHDEVEIVLNLTPPAAHVETSRRILAGGKHVWSEKPLAVTRDDAKALLAYADRAGLRVACAPDTFLGGALQTAQRSIAAGAIGQPKSAVAIMQSPGPERVHPQPEFFYAIGGGPLLDMGPYSVTALVQIMGGIQRVTALTSTAMPSREVIVGPAAGRRFQVSVSTQAMALLEFTSGAIGTMVVSFDSGVRRDLLEFHGTEATIQVPNPSRFEGDSTLAPLNDGPHELPTLRPKWGRGVGALELARAIRHGRPERASGALAYHVLDVLLAIQEAAATGAPVSIESKAIPPEPLPENWDPTEATLRQGSDTDREAAMR